MKMAKSSKKKRNPNEAAFFKRYAIEGRNAKNRAAALEKHVDNNPNDTQAEDRLNGPAFEYRRNKVGKPVIEKDTKDKYRLQKYIHNKPYPPQKRVSQNTGYNGVGKTLGELLLPYRGLFSAG